MKRLLLCLCVLLSVSVHSWASHIHSTRAERALEQLITSSGTILVDVGEGGTGASSLTAHAVLLGNGTSAIQAIACTTANQVWQSGSPGSCTGTPTIGTSVTTPVLIGGTGVASTLTLRSTSGVGAAGADIVFQVGNNGATEAMRILNSGTTQVQAGAGVALEVLNAVDLTTYLRAHGDNFTIQSINSDTTTRIDTANRNLILSARSAYLEIISDNTFNIRIRPGGNFLFGGTTSAGTGAQNVIVFHLGTAPSTSPADVVQEWVEDCAGAATACRKIRDEGGNVFTIGNNQMLTTATGDQGWLSRTLLRAAADGAFAVHNNAGTARFQTTSGAAAVGTQVRTAQATAPTCTTNCGTAPSISGSDTAMIVTLGTGTPASPVTVTFNGTWSTAPACQAANRTTAASSVARVDTTTTTAVIYFLAAPAASDLVAVTCLGVAWEVPSWLLGEPCNDHDAACTFAAAA